MTGFYERTHWHCHISPAAIFISWGAKCPGADCDGLQALMEEALQHAKRVLESEEGGWL